MPKHNKEKLQHIIKQLNEIDFYPTYNLVAKNLIDQEVDTDVRAGVMNTFHNEIYKEIVKLNSIKSSIKEILNEN